MESFWLAIFESPELPRSKMQSTGAAVSGRARSRATRRRKYSARDTPRSLARWRARRCISVSSVIWVFAIIMAPSYHIVHHENTRLSYPKFDRMGFHAILSRGSQQEIQENYLLSRGNQPSPRVIPANRPKQNWGQSQ